MLSKFAEFIVRKRWYVIVLWILTAVVVLVATPKLSDVTSNDQASFLPDKYESAQAQQIAKDAFPESQSQGQSATVVFKRNDNKQLTTQDQTQIQQVVMAINEAGIERVSGAMTAPQMQSDNKKLQLAQVSLKGDPQDEALLDAVASLRDTLRQELHGSHLSHAVTGGVAISLDTRDSAMEAEKIVGVVTVILILILPTIIFRSPFAALLPLISVGVIYAMATSLLALSAQVFDFQVSGQLTALLIVVLFGIGTDYILFLLFRYRERLRSGDHTRGAVSFALARAGEPIFSAALVVGAAFAAMFAASLGFFSSLAPGLIISVVLMLLASMTLVPALLAVIGEKIFWPSKKWQTEQTGSLAGKLGNLVAHHPGKITIVATVLLVALASGVSQYKASFDLVSQLPSDTESTRAFKELSAAYPAGTISPVTVYVQGEEKLDQAQLAQLATKLATVDGVANLVPIQTLGQTPTDTPRFVRTSADGTAAQLSLILKDDPTSDAAIQTVGGPLREAAHSTDLDATIAVGGETASYADLKTATETDIRTIVPLAATIIFVILAILLRSVIAPIYLLISVGLGVLATLGATTYLYMGLGDSTGLIFMLPIFLYLFVVAVGTDYNILMITRLREEILVEGNEPKLAAQRAVEHTTSTLIAAGVILAGTFASLMFAGLSLMTQMGFSVSFGIALGAFLISLLLIPAVSTLLGKWVWWPNHNKVINK